MVGAFLRDGWRVRAGARRPHLWPEGVSGVAVDRQDDASLVAAVGDGCDVVVDCVAFDEVHARQIVGLAGLVGSAVVLSSVGVYADARGRTLDEATNEEDFPVFGDDPVTERQTTVAPGPSTYSTRKVAMEQVLLEAELPVTVLRPGTITGQHSAHPRELWFVQRALDHRPVQILAHQGRSQFHTCSTPNLAELVRLAARRPGSRVLNAVDPTAPTTTEIGAAVNALMGHTPLEILLDGAPDPVVGQNPWGLPHPFVMNMSEAARTLGYQAVTDYQGALRATVSWLVDAVQGRDWQEVFPSFLRINGLGAFDYVAEDAWLARVP